MAELRSVDFTKEEPWRIFRIMGEFVDGIEQLSKIGPAVTIFGSARTNSKNKYYKLGEEIAYKLAKAKYAVITGAGSGIMEAANKGASKAGGKSVGLNIQVPVVQRPNSFVTDLIDFKYFFCRKVMFVKYALAFVVMPGGYGTMDEFFEAITLIQTQRMQPFPIILVGKDFWSGLIDWMKESMLITDRISKEDFKLFKLVDTSDEVLKAIRSFYKKK